MPVENISIFLYKASKILMLSLILLVIYYLINIGNKFVDKDKRIVINRRFIIPVFIGLVLLLILINLFKKYSILADTFYTIVFSIVLAYLFNPIIKRFEARGMKRLTSVLVLYLIILGIILIFAFLIIPTAAKEIKNFVSNMPEYINIVSDFITNLNSKYSNTILELPPIFKGLEDALKKNIASLEKMLASGLKSFFTGIANLMAKVVSLVLTPILTLYFLVDKEDFIGRFWKLIPNKYLEETRKLFSEIDNSLSLFVRGRLFMAMYVGVAITIVLLVFRVDFAIGIGLITGFADIIPYIGPFLGFLPAVFFAFLDSPIKAIWIGILFLLVQWTENNVLAPKIIGDTTGLHPMIVLLSIIIGGGMFGVLGMIFSVPFVAISIILYKFTKDKIKNKLENEKNTEV